MCDTLSDNHQLNSKHKKKTAQLKATHDLRKALVPPKGYIHRRRSVLYLNCRKGQENTISSRRLVRLPSSPADSLTQVQNYNYTTLGQASLTRLPRFGRNSANFRNRNKQPKVVFIRTRFRSFFSKLGGPSICLL